MRPQVLAFALAACGGATAPSTTPAADPPRGVCVEIDASLPRFPVRATDGGWQRISTEPIDGVGATSLDASQRRGELAIATVGDGACGAYGECIRGVFAVCGDELVLLRTPDYVFDLRFGEGSDVVETERLAGSQADEADRMERGEPVTAERTWRFTPRGYQPADAISE